jgi:hypothetical protein
MVSLRGNERFMRWKTDDGKQMDITCELKPVVWNDTFASRRIIIWNPDPTEALIPCDPNCENGAVLPWALDVSEIEDADHFTMTGHSLQSRPTESLNSTAVRNVLPGTAVTVRWETVHAESRRDGIFVIIGALVALGAAMLIEAVRPLIEELAGAGAHKKRHRERGR